MLDRQLGNDETALRSCSPVSGPAARWWWWSTSRQYRGAAGGGGPCDGHRHRYLPGLAMRRMADLYPGNAKTDARDAYVIADAARTMPHTLRWTDIPGPAMADLAVLTGYDDDLRDEVTAATNRLRNLLLRSTPPWNGPWANIYAPGGPGAAGPLGGPTGLQTAGRNASTPG